MMTLDWLARDSGCIPPAGALFAIFALFPPKGVDFPANPVQNRAIFVGNSRFWGKSARQSSTLDYFSLLHYF